MKTTFDSLFELENATATITCLVVAGTALYLMITLGDYSLLSLLSTAGLFLYFVVSWNLSIRDMPFTRDLETRLVLMVSQYLAIVAIFFLVPFSYTAILLIIWSCQFPYYMSVKRALLLSPLYSAPIWLVYYLQWDRELVLFTAMLFWTFNVFALVMIHTTLKEQRAREAANAVNRELMATQALLSEATKQAERVRIARNIHDLLGHHLTALTINLQVASRTTEGDAKEKIDQCHDLARLLLSDVREAVSEIREKSNLELQTVLSELAKNVPELDIVLDYDAQVRVTDVNVADAIIRSVQESITNSLKHGNASRFSIQVREQNARLSVLMEDNGQQYKTFEPGNGLTGIAERVRALGGNVTFDFSQRGFVTRIDLPEPV